MEEQGRDLLTNGDASPQPGEILLKVKSANHPCEDLEFHANYSNSIKQIKETIQRLSNLHPEIKEQRLIYSGHLLDDNQVLKDVLMAKNGSQFMMHNPSSPNQAVTMHLACTSKYIYNSTGSSSSGIGNKKLSNNEGHPSGSGQPTLFNNQGFHSAPNIELPQGVVNGVPQDMLSLHQLYVEQMTTYMNQWYIYQGAMSGLLPQASLVNSLNVPPQVGQFQQQRNDAPQAPPVPNVPQQDNIAAARAGDDEENQRDLLDWIYTGSRALLVFSVVYFYSSFSRFLLVVVFTALVMILQRRNAQVNQNGNRVAPRDAAQPQGPEIPQPAAERVQNENDLEREDGVAAGENLRRRNIEEQGVDNAFPEENGQAVVIEPPQTNIRVIAWTFLTTFFTSLIPETYQNN